MTFTLKEKELLKSALHLYIQETAGQYDFVKDLDITFSREFEENMQRLIKRRRKPLYYFFNTAAKRVACIIAALIIAAVGTVLSIDALREGVKNFFVESYEKFSRIIFQQDNDAPDTIEEYFAPSFIPEGYQKETTKKDATGYLISYINQQKGKITYMQSCIGSANTYINTEDGITEETSEGLYVYSPKTSCRMFFKSDDKYEYYITVPESISKEELLKIAESLKAE